MSKQAPGDLAEMAGSHIGMSALSAILAADSQAARLRVLHEALLDASDSPERARTLGGFAVALVNVLERGLGLDRHGPEALAQE